MKIRVESPEELVKWVWQILHTRVPEDLKVAGPGAQPPGTFKVAGVDVMLSLHKPNIDRSFHKRALMCVLHAVLEELQAPSDEGPFRQDEKSFKEKAGAVLNMPLGEMLMRITDAGLDLKQAAKDLEHGVKQTLNEKNMPGVDSQSVSVDSPDPVTKETGQVIFILVPAIAVIVLVWIISTRLKVKRPIDPSPLKIDPSAQSEPSHTHARRTSRLRRLVVRWSGNEPSAMDLVNNPRKTVDKGVASAARNCLAVRYFEDDHDLEGFLKHASDPVPHEPVTAGHVIIGVFEDPDGKLRPDESGTISLSLFRQLDSLALAPKPPAFEVYTIPLQACVKFRGRG